MICFFFFVALGVLFAPFLLRQQKSDIIGNKRV
jgi:hypothetical protein